MLHSARLRIKGQRWRLTEGRRPRNDLLELRRPGSVDHHDLFVSPKEGPTARLHPDAWAKLVPPDLIEALETLVAAGKRFLLVGDRPGDPDCFSAVALARFLRHLGVEADMHVGVKPPRQIEKLVEPHELKSEAEVRSKHYDAIIFVDNDGTGNRISPAAHEAAAKAEHIFVIDHHDPKPYPVSEGQSVHAWIETRADAAALLQLGLMTAMTKRARAPLSNDDWVNVAEPLLAGIYSDTGGLNPESTKSGALETYAFLADLLGTPAVDAIRRGFEAELPKELQKQIAKGLDHHLLGEKPRRALICSFSAAQTPVDLPSGDLYRAVLDQVEQLRERHQPQISLVLVALPADEAFGERVMLSVRTLDRKQATQLARELGDGSGKANGQAGATVFVPEGQTLEGLLQELLQRTEDLAEFSLAQASRLAKALSLKGGNL